MQKLGKESIQQDTPEQLVRRAGRAAAGVLTNLGRVAALTAIVLGGIVFAASFLAPGLALAGSMPTAGANGAHPWIVDGGGEVSDNLSWRLEITVEYIAIGVALIFVTLRFGKVWLAKLQDWYDAAPASAPTPIEMEPEPLPEISQFPAPMRRPIPRAPVHGGHSRGSHGGHLHAA